MEVSQAGAGQEFFATDIRPIEKAAEFTRLTFYSGGRLLSVVMTPTAFEAMVRLILSGPPFSLH